MVRSTVRLLVSGVLAFFVVLAGELGCVDEMLATYTSAEALLSPNNLLFCRLFVLAFSGRVEGVRSLLSRQLRFFSSRNKAYWTFIASRASGTDDGDARRTLQSYAQAADHETFRRRAQRHLDAAPTPGASALSAASRARIAAIDEALRKTKRYSVLHR
jgi:hypothetical protein